MQVVRVDVIGPFVSFKPPLEQRYHRTFKLPPKTVLLGLVGAALGINELEIYVQWNSAEPLADRIRLAVKKLSVEGQVQDLWKTLKFAPEKRKPRKPLKASEMGKYVFIQDANRYIFVEQTPITREQLYLARYGIYIEAENGGLLEEICRAFMYPAFPLSLGRDDELVLLQGIKRVNLKKANPPFEMDNVLLPFDIETKNAELILREGTTIRPYQRKKLPHRFGIAPNREREPLDKEFFTFLVDCPTKILDDSVEAYIDRETEDVIVFL
jgi:CRISPR-associated protein Cas5t/CRISPR-associated protein Cas5h